MNCQRKMDIKEGLKVLSEERRRTEETLIGFCDETPGARG
jgi:hypothetical protein